MRESERIADQLKRAFEGEAWHGPSLLEILKDVTAGQAAARPIPDGHSIWEIVLHIVAWESACRRRLAGDRAEPSDEEDWPAVKDTGEDAWQATKVNLEEGHQQLRQAIARLDESQLDEPILPGKSSVYVTVQGTVQHDLYHAGQIAILKKTFSGKEQRV